MKLTYSDGFRRGLPVGLGYFSVSFGFGAMAAAQGLDFIRATLISVTNLTSAGQFAGLTLMMAAAGLWEVILTQIVINSRYALMSLALGQKAGHLPLISKLIIAFFNTDEIFALAMSEKRPLTSSFMLGLGTLPIAGWTFGTLLGALAGSVLPLSVRTALGVMLYGMFIAIVVPPVKYEKPVLVTVAAALVLSCLFTWMPGLRNISSGISIVICTVLAAAFCAWRFPINTGGES